MICAAFLAQCLHEFRAPFSNKPYRPSRKKKSYWKPVLFLVLLGGLWFGYIQYWPTIEGWFKPTIHEVHSQTQAMGHLQGMLASWNGSDAELAQMASSVDKQVEWMNSPEARDSFAWLLAVEMDRRGMLKESEPMLAALLEKKLADSASMPAEDRNRLLGVSLNWAREFAGRKHDATAEKLYEVILKIRRRSRYPSVWHAWNRWPTMRMTRPGLSVFPRCASRPPPLS